MSLVEDFTNLGYPNNQYPSWMGNTADIGNTGLGDFANPTTPTNAPAPLAATSGAGAKANLGAVAKYVPTNNNGGKSGGGSGGGSGGTVPLDSQPLQDLFIDWFGVGKYSAAILTKATAEKWTADDVRRYAVDQGAAGPLATEIWNTVRRQLANGGIPASAAPAKVVQDIIRKGVYQDATYFSDIYIPTMAGFDVTTSSDYTQFEKVWKDATGIDLTSTAKGKLSDDVKQYGFAAAFDRWGAWVPTTDSAIAGNFGADRKIAIGDYIRSVLKREPTAAELDPKGSYWNMTPDALRLAVEATPEYKGIYANKPVDATPDEYIDQRKNAAWELEKWYGPGQAPTAVIDAAVTGGWTAIQIKQYAIANGANGPNALTAREQVLSAARSARGSEWASTLTDAQIDALAAGSYVDPTAYFTNYFMDMPGLDIMQSPQAQVAIDKYITMTGQPMSSAAKDKLGSLASQYGGLTPDALTEFYAWIPTTNAAATGNWGADHRAGIISTVTKLLGREPTSEELAVNGALWSLDDAALEQWAKGTPEYQTRFAGKPADVSEAQFLANKAGWTAAYRHVHGLGVSEIVDEATINALVTDGYRNSYTPDQWAQASADDQRAIVNEGTYDPILLETMGIDLSHEDWTKYTTQAEGSGDIQLKINEAQNRMAFKQDMRNYFGQDYEPTPADYAAVTRDFVSPSEFVQRMAAKESAKQQIGPVNELLGRVFGTTVGLPELENMAMGGEGSGVLKAQLDQASRLDEYRWVHKQKYGTEPTPTDYAKYAGYAGPAELTWELTLAENMKEFGPDIMETWNKVYADKPITDAQLRVMLGDQKGSGELKYQYKQAQETVTKATQAHDAGFTTPDANIIFQASQQGGFKTGMPSLDDLVGSMN